MRSGVAMVGDLGCLGCWDGDMERYALMGLVMMDEGALSIKGNNTMFV